MRMFLVSISLAIMLFSLSGVCTASADQTAQDPPWVQDWKAMNNHCSWKDQDGKIRPHQVLAFADRNGVAKVPWPAGKITVLHTKDPYEAVCSFHLFPKAKRQCASGACFREAERPAKDCKGEVPIGGHCWHVARKRKK